MAPEAQGHVPSRNLVVDTDVFIWLIRGKDEAVRFGPAVAGRRIVLSFSTVAELWRGAHTRAYGEASRAKLEGDVRAAIVVPPTDAVTHEWARLVSDARAASHPLGQKAQAHDAWVAATARHLGLPLLTNNTRHFQGLRGITLVDLPPD